MNNVLELQDAMLKQWACAAYRLDKAKIARDRLEKQLEEAKDYLFEARRECSERESRYKSLFSKTD